MEHYKLTVYETAKADMRDAVTYVSKTLREPETARSLLQRFRETVLSLALMPERFGLVSDRYLAALGLRMAPVGNYLIFYTVDISTRRVDVVRVLYGRRDWMQILKDQ